MRHFEQTEITERYTAYRPRVQTQILGQIAAASGWRERFAVAVDVACGTGHSTKPLTQYAERVLGFDISEEMLVQARAAFPNITFQAAPAENLPLEANSVDLLSVSFAFHWFDQPEFLNEVVRVLKPDGYFVFYNMVFPAEMAGNEAFQIWNKEVYRTRYPTPKRHRTPLKELLENVDLELESVVTLDIPLTLSALELRNYFTTQSNVATALDKGQTLAKIDDWLDRELATHFTQPKETFAYRGQAAVLRPN